MMHQQNPRLKEKTVCPKAQQTEQEFIFLLKKDYELPLENPVALNPELPGHADNRTDSWPHMTSHGSR